MTSVFSPKPKTLDIMVRTITAKSRKLKAKWVAEPAEPVIIRPDPKWITDPVDLQ